MNLENPIAAFNAETNMEAILVQRFLESHGIQAFATEDNSLVGHWMFGNLPEIHKPQVWIDQSDAEIVSKLLSQYEEEKLARDADRNADVTATVDVQCEDCGKISTFASSLNGTVQDCSHCGAFMDVGDVDWPFDEDLGETEDEAT